MEIRVRCTWCGHVYDLTRVEVTARYLDCSMWRCPGCKTLVDDRGDTGWKSRKDYVRVEDEPERRFNIHGTDWAMRERRRNGVA